MKKESLAFLEKKGVLSSYKENDNFISVDIILKNDIFLQIIIDEEDVTCVINKDSNENFCLGYDILGRMQCNLITLVKINFFSMEIYITDENIKDEDELIEHIVNAYSAEWVETEGEIEPSPNGGKRFLAERDRGFVEGIKNFEKFVDGLIGN